MISSNRRIVYLPQSPENGSPMWPSGPSDPPPRAADIDRSLGALDPVRRDIVERRFWLGHTLAQISRSYGMPAEWTRRELCKALAQLRQRLSGDSGTASRRDCKLCMHAERGTIDRLLRVGQQRGTWRGYLNLLRSRFGITGLPAKALEAHLNHHTPLEEESHDHAGSGPR